MIINTNWSVIDITAGVALPFPSCSLLWDAYPPVKLTFHSFFKTLPSSWRIQIYINVNLLTESIISFLWNAAGISFSCHKNSLNSMNLFSLSDVKTLQRPTETLVQLLFDFCTWLFGVFHSSWPSFTPATSSVLSPMKTTAVSIPDHEFIQRYDMESLITPLHPLNFSAFFCFTLVLVSVVFRL